VGAYADGVAHEPRTALHGGVELLAPLLLGPFGLLALSCTRFAAAGGLPALLVGRLVVCRMLFPVSWLLPSGDAGMADDSSSVAHTSGCSYGGVVCRRVCERRRCRDRSSSSWLALAFLGCAAGLSSSQGHTGKTADDMTHSPTSSPALIVLTIVSGHDLRKEPGLATVSSGRILPCVTRPECPLLLSCRRRRTNVGQHRGEAARSCTSDSAAAPPASASGSTPPVNTTLCQCSCSWGETIRPPPGSRADRTRRSPSSPSLISSVGGRFCGGRGQSEAAVERSI